MKRDAALNIFEKMFNKTNKLIDAKFRHPKTEQERDLISKIERIMNCNPHFEPSETILEENEFNLISNLIIANKIPPSAFRIGGALFIKENSDWHKHWNELAKEYEGLMRTQPR